MVEIVKIFNLNKLVFLLDLDVGCFFVDSCLLEEFGKFKVVYFDVIVVFYINCIVVIKVMSDIICISFNFVKIVK